MEQDSVGSSRRLSRPEVFRHSSFEFNPTIFFRKTNCAKATVRNKISKMTYLHIYFDSYGVTKFTKSQRFGWQVGLIVNSRILLIFFILGACWCLWRCCWSLHGVQPVKRSWVYLLLYTQVQYLFTKSTSGWIILSPRFDTLLQVLRNYFLISRLFIDFCRQQKKK